MPSCFLVCGPAGSSMLLPRRSLEGRTLVIRDTGFKYSSSLCCLSLQCNLYHGQTATSQISFTLISHHFLHPIPLSYFRSLLCCVLTKASGQPYSSGIRCFRRQLSARPAPSGAGRFFCFPLCFRYATSFAWGVMVPLPSAVNSTCPFWRR